jgi:hypothetical protein
MMSYIVLSKYVPGRERFEEKSGPVGFDLMFIVISNLFVGVKFKDDYY